MKKKKQWKMQGNWQKSQNFSETCKRNSQQCGQENVNIVNTNMTMERIAFYSMWNS